MNYTIIEKNSIAGKMLSSIQIALHRHFHADDRRKDVFRSVQQPPSVTGSCFGGVPFPACSQELRSLAGNTFESRASIFDCIAWITDIPYCKLPYRICQSIIVKNLLIFGEWDTVAFVSLFLERSWFFETDSCRFPYRHALRRIAPARGRCRTREHPAGGPALWLGGAERRFGLQRGRRGLYGRLL